MTLSVMLNSQTWFELRAQTQAAQLHGNTNDLNIFITFY